MSIKLRGGVWHCDFTTPDGRRIRRSLETEDKRQAQELHDRLKSESWRVDRLGDFPAVTFEEACIRWLDEKDSKKSLDDDKSRIGFWMQHFSGVPISAITEQKIYSAISKMTNRRHEENWRIKAEAMIKKGRTPPAFKPKPVAQATKNTHLAFIRALLRAAERDWKLLERAPNIKTPTPKNKRIRWLEPHEAQRLIDECSDPLKSVVEFALSTGLRRSNIIDLEWSQIDMQRRVAWVNPEDSKNGRAIGVALNDVACQVLRKQIGRSSQHVFVYVTASTRPDGSETKRIRKMRYDANTGWRAALRRAGITNFRFHDLRHTWASWLVQAGVPLSVLQEMGGWESIEMVRRYAHLAPNHLAQHASQIDKILRSDDTNTAQASKLRVG